MAQLYITKVYFCLQKKPDWAVSPPPICFFEVRSKEVLNSLGITYSTKNGLELILAESYHQTLAWNY